MEVAACYVPCGTAAATCFTAAGYTFGTLTGAQIAAVPALVHCNKVFSACEKACTTTVKTAAFFGLGLMGAVAVGAVGVGVGVGVGYFLYRAFQAPARRLNRRND